MHRYSSFCSLVLLALLGALQPLSAATVTNGGPGGMGTTDGSSNLRLWYKSDTQVYSDVAGTIAAAATDPVRRWNNLAGTGLHDAIADVALREPSLVAGFSNGLPGISFTGGTKNTGSRLTVASTALGFTQYAMTGDETAFFALDFTTGAHNGILSANDVVDNRGWDGGNSSMFESTSFTYANNFFVNGVDTATTGTGMKIVTGTDNPRDAANVTLRFGSGHGGNNDYGGRLLETIIFNNELNSAQRIVAENYLSSRYDVALAAGDHYAGDTLSAGNYDFGVFGIGREDVSNAHTSGGSAGFGLEANGVLDNGDWLFAGHKVSSNTLVDYEADDPNFAGQRWARVWNVDKTGTLDATLAFDFEDAGLTAPGFGQSFQLLYSADDDFSDGWEILAETFTQSDGTVTFALLDADLLEGYYTLGIGIGYVPEPNSMLLMLGMLGCGYLRRRRSRIASQRRATKRSV